MLDVLLHYPRRVLIGALVLTLASVALLFRLRPETSIDALLDPSDPAVGAHWGACSLASLSSKKCSCSSRCRRMKTTLASSFDFAANGSTTPSEKMRMPRALIDAVRYKPSPDMRRFVERVVGLNGVYYLDDEAYAAALKRLTRAGMDEQLRRDRELLSVPGPAAAGIGKALLKDPLRLSEFLMGQLANLSPGGGTFAGPPAPGGLDAFFSSDRRSVLIRIAGKRPANDLEFCREITACVDRVSKQANTDRLTLDATGAFVVAAYNTHAIRGDSITSVNGSVVGLAILFFILYRRPLRFFSLAFIPTAMGVACGFGAYAIGHTRFTPLAAVVGGGLGGIGVDYSVYFLTHYHRARASYGSTIEAVLATLRNLRRPLFAAWITSVIGFVAVAFSPIRVLRDFAVVGTLALGGAYLAATLVTPAMLLVFSRRRRICRVGFIPPGTSVDANGGMNPTLQDSKRSSMHEGGRTWLMLPLRRFVTRYARPCVVTMIVLVLGLATAAAITAHRVSPDANLSSLHPHPNPPLDAQKKVTSVMGVSPGSVQIELRADSPTALLQLAHDVDRRLKNDAAVKAAGMTRSFSVANVLPDPRRSIARREGIEPDFADRVERDFRAALAASDFNSAGFEPYVVFLRRLVTPTDPPGIDALLAYPQMAQLVLSRAALAAGPAKSTSTTRVSTTPANEALYLAFFDDVLDMRDRRDAALIALSNALAGLDGVTVTGMAAVSRHVDLAVRRDLPKVSLAALGAIAVVLAIHFRSLRLGLLAIVPTVVSVASLAAYICVFGVPLNVINMLMIPVLLSLNTDYGILSVAAYTRARSRFELLRPFPTTCFAVMSCALATSTGFGALIITSVPAVRSLGELIIVGVLSCFLGSVFALWPAMILLKGTRSETSASALRRVD